MNATFDGADHRDVMKNGPAPVVSDVDGIAENIQEVGKRDLVRVVRDTTRSHECRFARSIHPIRIRPSRNQDA